jgi:hypothetical protein
MRNTIKSKNIEVQLGIFSNYNCGYADLPKRLWLCVKAHGSSNIYLFIVSVLNIIIKRQTSRYLVGYLPVKFTKVLLENTKPNTSRNPRFAESQTYFLKWKLVFMTRKLGLVWL